MASEGVNEPTDYYLRTKRNAVFFAGLLLLAAWVGIVYSPNEQGTLLPVKLGNPSAIPTVLAAISTYYALQLSLSWYSQDSIVRTNPIFRFDYWLTVVLWSIAAASYLVVILRPQDHAEWFAHQWWVFFAIFVAAFVPIITVAPRFILRRQEKRIRTESLDIERVATNGLWTLIFNPSTGAGKQIRFLAGGEIGEGQNKNENRWRVRDGYLELLNERGELFSRFRYDPVVKFFEHTNDSDTQSLRFQKIFRQDPPGLGPTPTGDVQKG